MIEPTEERTPDGASVRGFLLGGLAALLIAGLASLVVVLLVWVKHRLFGPTPTHPLIGISVGLVALVGVGWWRRHVPGFTAGMVAAAVVGAALALFLINVMISMCCY